MATPTYDLLASTTLTTSASSVTFSSIDQSYGCLILVTETLSATSTASNFCRVNGDSGGNYYGVWMKGDGSSATSSAPNGSLISAQISSTTTDSVLVRYEFLDYSATDKHKPILIRSGQGASKTVAAAYRWSDTAAINSILITALSSSYASGSTFNLYGVAK